MKHFLRIHIQHSHAHAAHDMNMYGYILHMFAQIRATTAYVFRLVLCVGCRSVIYSKTKEEKKNKKYENVRKR